MTPLTTSCGRNLWMTVADGILTLGVGSDVTVGVLVVQPLGVTVRYLGFRSTAQTRNTWIVGRWYLMQLWTGRGKGEGGWGVPLHCTDQEHVDRW